MKTFELYFHGANRWALIILLAAMAVIIFTNVALRYLTSQSIEWAEEVSRHMMIWLTFLGAGPVLRYGGHIAVENLQDALPQSMAIAVRAFVALLLFAFFGFMIWYGWLYMDRAMFTAIWGYLHHFVVCFIILQHRYLNLTHAHVDY